MFWIITTLLALGGMAAVHLAWRRRMRRWEEAMEGRLNFLVSSGRAASQQAEALREAMFNSMVEGVVLLDAAGRIQFANPPFHRLFALPGDARGQTLLEATRMHELAEMAGSLDAGSPAQRREVRLTGLNDQFLDVSAAAVFGAQGQQTGGVLVFHDVTSIKRLERTREEFVANVSHELRTPLSLIKGYAETLLDGAQCDPEQCAKFLQIIDRNADRLKLLIEDLLIISELESGRVRLELRDVELGPLAARACDDFRPRAAAREIHLNNEVPGSLRVGADPNRLQQVLSNLLDNAIKYGKTGGTASIRAFAAEGNEVRVCVADDGPGIPGSMRERVFERFYRVDKARSREQGGTGLGLAIVKHIVQSHGGRVWLESEPGAGSRFWFSLPGAAAPQDGGSMKCDKTVT